MRLAPICILLALVPAAAGAAGGAASGAAGSWTWGVRAGVGGADFTGSLGDSSTSAIVAFDGGVFASRPIGPVSFEPQLIVASRGAVFTDPILGTFTDGFGNHYLAKVGEYSGTLQLFYVEAPMLVRVPAGPWFFGPHVVGGAVPAVLVTGSYTGDPYLRDFGSGTFRHFAIGWTAGLGTRWPTPRGMLTIDFRFEDVEGDVFKPGRGMSGRTEAWLLGVGWEIGRKGRAPTGPGHARR